MRALLLLIVAVLLFVVACATPSATSVRAPVPDDAELAAVADQGVALVAGHFALAHDRPVPVETIAALPSWSDLPKHPELSSTIDAWDAPLRQEERRDVAGGVIKKAPLSFVNPTKRFEWQERGAPIAGACARRVGSTIAVDVVLDGIDAVAVFERVVKGPSGKWVFGHPRFRATGTGADARCPGGVRRAPTLHVEPRVLSSAAAARDAPAEPFASSRAPPADPLRLALTSRAAVDALRSGDDDAIVALASPARAPRSYDEWRAMNGDIVAALRASREDFVRLQPAFIIVSPERHAATVFGKSADGLVATSISLWFSRVDGHLDRVMQTEATKELSELGENEHRGRARPTYAINDDGVLVLQPSMQALAALPCHHARAPAMQAIEAISRRAREAQRLGPFAFTTLFELGYPEPFRAGLYTIKLEGSGADMVIVATGSGVASGDVIRVNGDSPVPSLDDVCSSARR